MDRRKLFLWALYDFANSIVYITFVLYFAEWLVVDGGISDFWYNAIFAITTIALLCSAPVLAARVDARGNRKWHLGVATIGTALAYTVATLCAYHDLAIAAVVCFAIGQYFYQLSFVFYNAMIESVADVEHRARASGVGEFWNAAGQIAGLVLALAIGGGRLDSLLPSIALFVLLALPLLLWFEDNATLAAPTKEQQPFFKRMYTLYFLSAAAPLLIAYFFFNDALITLTNNYSIFMQQVFATPDFQKNLLLLAVVAMGGIGGVSAGWISDRVGIKRVLVATLVACIVVLPFLALAPSFAFFAAFTIPLSILIGAILAISRAYLSTLLPSSEMTYGFSFFTLSERFATFFGPITWGVVVSVMHEAAIAYRMAALSMMVYIALGIVVAIYYNRAHVPKVSN